MTGTWSKAIQTVRQSWTPFPASSVTKKNLTAIKELLQATNWIPDMPYCSFRFPFDGNSLIGIFEMNEAAVSKLPLDWIRETLENLPAVEQIQKESESLARESL